MATETRTGAKARKHAVCMAAGAILMAATVISLIWFSVPTMGAETVHFQTEYNGKTSTLEGTYTEAPDAEYAVLICEGFSCDRQKWRPFTNLLVSNGFTAMTVDYSGQGGSTGTIGFDNAKTDQIPLEIYRALVFLHEKSGIPYENIILLSHSMGGRAILRLLTFTEDNADAPLVFDLPVQNLIFLSPNVSYEYSAQASFFTGVIDAELEPWKSYNESCTGGRNIYLYGSTGDDIVSDGSVRELYRRLGGQNVPETGAVENLVQYNGSGSKLTLGIATGILHSYEMFSTKFAAIVSGALEDITGRAMTYPAWSFAVLYWSWFVGAAGIFLLLCGMNGRRTWASSQPLPQLTDVKGFLLRKLLLWLPALVIMVLICCFSVVMPFGSPVMNIVFMGSIAGYGVTMLFCYRKGRFRGTAGKLPRPTLRADRRSWPLAVAAVLVFGAYAIFALRAGMYRLYPWNARWFWLIFATVIMSLGYYISGCEVDMLHAAGVGRGKLVLYNLIQYVPLFLLTAGYFALKSYSGFIGQVQNMVLMYILCIPLGNYVKKATGSRLYGAVTTAFFFQSTMITSTSLIALF